MEDFIEGFGITQNKLAVAMAAGVPIRRLCHAVSATPPLARSGCDSLSAAPAGLPPTIMNVIVSIDICGAVS